MANIPAGVIFIWAGTNASIPSGWVRETSLDDKFPKGNASSTNPNLTGGSASHTHTSPAHAHTISAHTHSVTLGAASGSKTTGSTSSGAPTSNHGHVAAASGAATGGGLSSVTSTYDSVASEPPYYKVIFIKKGTPTSGVPNSAIAFHDSATIPDSWKKCDGNNSTPDLTDKFLKGASTGADAGTTGGASTHTEHAITHTHTETGHTHAQSTSGGYTATTQFETAAGTASAVVTHSHTMDLQAATVTYAGTASSGSASNEPAYKKLMVVQNQKGVASAYVGMIGLWLGTLTSIPNNWSEVTAMNDKHLKVTNTGGDINSTGGSNAHTHSDSHTHTGGSHTHSATISTAPVTNNVLNSGRSLPIAHSHAATVTSDSASWESASTTADSSSNEPEYRTVAFIKLNKLTKGASFLLNMV